MQTIIYGMAVLCVRIMIVCMALTIGRGVRWNHLMKPQDKRLAVGVYAFVCVAIGHLVGSFAISIIETIQQMVGSLVR